MLLAFISVWCFLTSIAASTNSNRLAPEILTRDPFNPSNSQHDASKNIFNVKTRPHPVENNVILQNEEPRLCQNSEILVKILNILQKMVTHDSTKGEKVTDVLNSVKENLKSDPGNIKSADILNNLDDLEKLIEVDDGTSKPVLRQYTYRSAPGKLKTKIVFKYELPSISHPNCKEAFEKLIQTAHGAYLKLSNDPMCEDKGQNGKYQPNHNEISPDHHPLNYFSNIELQKNMPSDNSFNNDGSAIPFNSVPQDFLLNTKNNEVYPNNILELLKNYNYNKNTDFPQKENEHFNLGPDFFNQVYQHETNGNKFPVTNDPKFKGPISDNEPLNDNIFKVKYSENINSPASTENKNKYPQNYDVITDILNKYDLAKLKGHKNPEYQDNDGVQNDKNNDGPNVKDDKLLFEENNIYGPVLNDSDYNNPNKKANYDQYLNEIKNLISQNPQQPDQNPDVQKGIYSQDLISNMKYLPNKPSHHHHHDHHHHDHDHSLDSAPMQYYNIHGVPYTSGKYPYQLNVNNLNPNHLPIQKTITANKNGLDPINPNINNIQNAVTYYNGVPYLTKDLANINGPNKQNIAVPDSYYNPDLLHYGNQQPVEENTSPNLHHLLSVTNLYKLNDLPHKADIIELTYMLKRSEPLVYQPFYIVKYRLPYTKFLYNVHDLISRKPYLRTNHEKLYQELIALSNVTETSDDLKGYPKEDIVKLTFNNGALVTAKILNANDTNINEQLKVIQNLNSNLNPEDILKLNKDNANKYYTRSRMNISEPFDSNASNNSLKGLRSINYGNEIQYQQPKNINWNQLQQNNQRPVLTGQNSNMIKSIRIPQQRNTWNSLQQNNQIPVLPTQNSNMINPIRIPQQRNTWNSLQQNYQRPVLPNQNSNMINPIRIAQQGNTWNSLQQNSQRPVLPNQNSNMINPNRVLQQRNVWNSFQQNNQRPVLPTQNTQVLNPSIIPAVLASQQGMSNRLPMYGMYGK